MKRIFKYRGLLMLPPMVFITFCTWSEVENSTLVFGLGGLVFALGLGLRLWAQMHLHYRLKTRKVLTTTGPYAYVRNPIYVANTAMLVAACMLAELFWFAPIQALYCGVVYALVVRDEEAHLTAKYGAPYREYLKSIPRWLPKLRRLDVRQPSAATYFLPSVWAEVHNFLWLAPFLVKELFCR
jgi:protein-S-isoprenylcysteine O-methyltransferase Ste14